MIFKESDLSFNFSADHWVIKKYDTHRYFKILSGAGLKGVDFLGIYEGKQVVFFEVKHFHTNHPTKPPSYLIFQDLEAFIAKIVDKAHDLIRAISIINQYLERKWWFRLFLKSSAFFPAFLIKNRDWYFWYRVAQLMWVPLKEQPTFVLWLEIEAVLTEKTKDKIHQQIKARLSTCLLYTSPSPRDLSTSRMPSSA